MEHYSDIKNNEFIDKWILAQKPGISKIQFTDQMRLKKKEEQSIDTLILLRRGNKIPTGGNTEIIVFNS